ncbi:MAG: HNH endonuclease [Nanobdellota archaeon]
MSKTKIPPRLRTEVLARDGHKCLWCNRGPADGITLHIDHVHPECFGGSTTIDNLGTLCSECNLGKGGEYYGNYLLSTILKVPNIWDRIKKFSKEDPGICFCYTWRLEFYEFEGKGYQENKILHRFSIDSVLVEFKDKSANMEIQFREAEEKALLDFKNLVKDFLFENKGFFELSGDKLVFKKFKEK